MTKPSIKKGPASAYAQPGETIVEFSTVIDGKLAGGLISMRAIHGKLRVEIYRTDPGMVEVVTSKGTLTYSDALDARVLETA